MRVLLPADLLCPEGAGGVTDRYEVSVAFRTQGVLTEVADGSNRIEDISVAMGHASTKTTEGYYTRTKEDQAMSRIMANNRSRMMM